ncbi:uncharacterized protein PHALS_01267 [Plasmopara halstedii]|uniref:Uncharacterized protein n=1 Tax=Plasmopara halstedii TaxID=4781 RepID=A0A0P1AVG7_PLAHL|nr:uncharacterized protein PHALS_01267 [Plasmopara halstedii]CEG44944.1 hypothetical protein PHALS_01267 [Plasmopara halstedii]|eukprot:XP_024581313.1 hypothetical protein PHALS_01267 [Plasmopara halstedii]
MEAKSNLVLLRGKVEFDLTSRIVAENIAADTNEAFHAHDYTETQSSARIAHH